MDEEFLGNWLSLASSCTALEGSRPVPPVAPAWRRRGNPNPAAQVLPPPPSPSSAAARGRGRQSLVVAGGGGDRWPPIASGVGAGRTVAEGHGAAGLAPWRRSPVRGGRRIPGERRRASVAARRKVWCMGWRRPIAGRADGSGGVGANGWTASRSRPPSPCCKSSDLTPASRGLGLSRCTRILVEAASLSVEGSRPGRFVVQPTILENARRRAAFRIMVVWPCVSSSVRSICCMSAS